MKKILAVILLSSFSLCQSLYAKDCEEGATVQGEVISCMYETYFSPLDKQVQNEYRTLKKLVKNSTNVSEDTLSSLILAQQSWEAYRDATCEFVWNKAGGATVVWGEKYNCLMDFDNARLKALQRYKQGL